MSAAYLIDDNTGTYITIQFVFAVCDSAVRFIAIYYPGERHRTCSRILVEFNYICFDNMIHM